MTLTLIFIPSLSKNFNFFETRVGFRLQYYKNDISPYSYLLYGYVGASKEPPNDALPDAVCQ